MPYAQSGDAIERTNHGVNHRVIEKRNREAWAKVSETLPDDAFADDVDDSDTVPYRRGFSAK